MKTKYFLEREGKNYKIAVSINNVPTYAISGQKSDNGDFEGKIFNQNGQIQTFENLNESLQKDVYQTIIYKTNCKGVYL